MALDLWGFVITGWSVESSDHNARRGKALKRLLLTRLPLLQPGSGGQVEPLQSHRMKPSLFLLRFINDLQFKFVTILQSLYELF